MTVTATVCIQECIQAGDGAPLVLPIENIYCTDNMASYKQTVPVFRYNPAVVPPYGLNNGHWFLACSFVSNSVETLTCISFIIDWQQQIKNCLESCEWAALFFLPDNDIDK